MHHILDHDSIQFSDRILIFSYQKIAKKFLFFKRKKENLSTLSWRMSNNWLWTLSCCLRFISASLWSMATASVFSRTNRKSSSKIPPGKKKVVCNDIPNSGRLHPVQSVLCRRFLASGKWHSQPKLWFLPSKHCHFHTQWNFMAVVRSKWILIHPFRFFQS